MERSMAPDFSQPLYFFCLLMTRSLLLRVRFDCLLVLLLLHLSRKISSWLAGGGEGEKKKVGCEGGRGGGGKKRIIILLLIDKNPDDLGPR